MVSKIQEYFRLFLLGIYISCLCAGILSTQFLSDFWATTCDPSVAKTREILWYLTSYCRQPLREQPKIWWASTISYTRHQKMNFINLLFLAPQFELPDLILLDIFHKPPHNVKSVLVKCLELEYKAMYSLWCGSLSDLQWWEQ